MSSWKFFVSVECTKLSMLIFAVFGDHFHMFILPGDFMKHGVNGDDFYFIKQQRRVIGENQDGGVGRHTAPPRTTRTDRESNSKGDQHQGNRK